MPWTWMAVYFTQTHAHRNRHRHTHTQVDTHMHTRQHSERAFIYCRAKLEGDTALVAICLQTLACPSYFWDIWRHWMKYPRLTMAHCSRLWAFIATTYNVVQLIVPYNIIMSLVVRGYEFMPKPSNRVMEVIPQSFVLSLLFVKNVSFVFLVCYLWFLPLVGFVSFKSVAFLFCVVTSARLMDNFFYVCHWILYPDNTF